MPSRARRHQEAEVPVARPGAVTLANSRRNGYTRPASVTRLDILTPCMHTGILSLLKPKPSAAIG